jgi:uncharacterized protein YcaQ
VLPARALGVAAEAELRDYFHLPVAGLERAVAELVEDKVLLPVALRGWAWTRQPSPSAATAVLTGYQAGAAEQSEASQPSDWTRLRLPPPVGALTYAETSGTGVPPIFHLRLPGRSGCDGE